MSLPENAREIDPQAEADRLTKERGRLDNTVVDEFHRVVTGDGHRYYARIQVTASEAHPLPRQLLAQLMQALRDSWGAENCCVCASAEVVYHNYQEKPFCRSCADGERPEKM